ncbi:MAG TPA: glycosyltransferase 87 family protein [Jatrophihabitantaceae bacterium]
MTHAAPADPVPSRTDPTVWRASRIIGGPWGRYAVATSWWTPLRALLLLGAFTLLLAYGEKAPCADGNWTANKQYTHACYSDVIPLWGAERLDAGAVPYRDNGVEYPVLTGGFMWATAGITRGLHALFGTQNEGVLFAMITCIGLAVCGLLVIAGTVGAAGRRPYDAAIFALSPLLVFHAFSNWDLLAMALAACALWAWAKEKPVAAGVLLGLGTAAKLYPLFLLLPIAILAVRTARYRAAVWCGVATVATWLAVNLPIAAGYYGGWREFYAFSADRDAEASTFWFIGHYLATTGIGNGYPPGWSPPGVAVALVLILALGAVTALGLLAPVRPRLAQLAFLAVFAFLITTKVWSPQYSLWLVPLVALARPRWRITLLWQFSEIVVWVVTLLWLLGFNDGAHATDYGWLMLTLLIRDGFLFVIAGLIVYEMWHPDADVVRASGLDDPGGGPFDNAPDVWRQYLLDRAERRRAIARHAVASPDLDADEVQIGPR